MPKLEGEVVWLCSATVSSGCIKRHSIHNGGVDYSEQDNTCILRTHDMMNVWRSCFDHGSVGRVGRMRFTLL
jgi:hypothetical protein